MSEHQPTNEKAHVVRPARVRQQSRQQRRELFANVRTKVSDVSQATLGGVRRASNSEQGKAIIAFLRKIRGRLQTYSQALPLMKLLAGALLAVIVLFFAFFLLGGRVFPNVWAMGIGLGGLSVDEAEQRLNEAWASEIQIELIADDDLVIQVTPADLGLTLDARATAEAARDAGVAGIPFGTTVRPVVELEFTTAQRTLLGVSEEVYVPVYEAGFEWADGTLTPVDGRGSRELDISQSLDLLSRNLVRVARDQQFELVTFSTLPAVIDPSPFLAQANEFIARDIQLVGYDPFAHEFIPWTTTKDVVSGWLAVDESGLTLRENAFEEFVDALNQDLQRADGTRYLQQDETADVLRQAIANQESTFFLRIRHTPSQYTVVSGDTSFRIARKHGLPQRHIADANQGVDWNLLSINDVVEVPSPDIVLEHPPLSHKRIIIDLERLWLVAFEDDEIVFNWQISVGRSDAPTSPGVYQILSKVDVAYGSTFDLCTANTCGQWEMNAFMGIYDVIPGFTNGFHGAVTLPNGTYLGGGNTGEHNTYGCVMSENGNAELLYDWAELGTMVEIISDEYPAKSELGQQALTFIDEFAAATGI